MKTEPVEEEGKSKRREEFDGYNRSSGSFKSKFDGHSSNHAKGTYYNKYEPQNQPQQEHYGRNGAKSYNEEYSDRKSRFEGRYRDKDEKRYDNYGGPGKHHNYRGNESTNERERRRIGYDEKYDRNTGGRSVYKRENSAGENYSYKRAKYFDSSERHKGTHLNEGYKTQYAENDRTRYNGYERRRKSRSRSRSRSRGKNRSRSGSRGRSRDSSKNSRGFRDINTNEEVGNKGEEKSEGNELHENPAKVDTEDNGPDEKLAFDKKICVPNDPRLIEEYRKRRAILEEKKLDKIKLALYKHDRHTVHVSKSEILVLYKMTPLVTLEQIKVFFTQFGTLGRIELKTDPFTGMGLGIAMVEYTHVKDGVHPRKAISKAIEGIKETDSLSADIKQAHILYVRNIIGGESNVHIEEKYGQLVEAEIKILNETSAIRDERTKETERRDGGRYSRRDVEENKEEHLMKYEYSRIYQSVKERLISELASSLISDLKRRYLSKLVGLELKAINERSGKTKAEGMMNSNISVSKVKGLEISDIGTENRIKDVLASLPSFRKPSLTKESREPKTEGNFAKKKLSRREKAHRSWAEAKDKGDNTEETHEELTITEAVEDDTVKQSDESVVDGGKVEVKVEISTQNETVTTNFESDASSVEIKPKPVLKKGTTKRPGKKQGKAVQNGLVETISNEIIASGNTQAVNEIDEDQYLSTPEETESDSILDSDYSDYGKTTGRKSSKSTRNKTKEKTKHAPTLAIDAQIAVDGSKGGSDKGKDDDKDINGEDIKVDINDDTENDVYNPKNSTGSARTEGYYKPPIEEKKNYVLPLLPLFHWTASFYISKIRENNFSDANTNNSISNALSSDRKNAFGENNEYRRHNIAPVATSGSSSSRSNRAASRKLRAQLTQTLGHNRRLLDDKDGYDSGNNGHSESSIRLNSLVNRKKSVYFAKSSIHSYGLFTKEHIYANEFVIEYVGELIRSRLSDSRELCYAKLSGTNDCCYLFRVDNDLVVDATMMGNNARFINHSCNPNCTAKVIQADGTKRIVIYAKSDIAAGEEITYDYKFNRDESDRIRCLCGSVNCRGYLN
ncbi:Histone-lysine N-methyltransferase, H3 lysine-4 specific [Zancudomyces culisetae]|uniref:[histone H3]-lysine(4) N-trimethyltransferase n=1 Tax=Zancudomyces culisetae TaxID=1213189 RepID=A0A1R1PK60_ZANCU|nr:Histone-lysine N-methyltransferase, H3 lysine-4 specific [Zancudomyces culisetae]|eukprot:OMH81303.1 Histone-lysine N-methyltransferase, H3 lysine-4 specific [Zancudomyces culisetae]